MESAPKSLRTQIALFGRTNVGKSSFLNMIAGQDIALVSEIPGTTTDVVEKPLELLPFGPVTFLDTAGLDDVSELGSKRIEKTLKILDRAEIALLVLEPNIWTDYEIEIAKNIKKRNIPIVYIINKIDTEQPNEEFLKQIKDFSTQLVFVSCTDLINRDKSINTLKTHFSELITNSGTAQNVTLLGDLIPAGGLVVLIIPIDLQAPKGRLILPQVQAIRDCLDNDAMIMVVKDREYADALKVLNRKPDLVVCDSQVVFKMVADTPDDVKCTTFSILFSRLKGDLLEEVRGAAAIDKLKEGDKVLIAEACSHHSLEDDIGKIKIPRWLRQYLGFDIKIDFVQGRDFPENLNEYQAVIHCGSCMLTRNEKLVRIQKSKNNCVPITNYGITISLLQGVLKRVLSPFPAALELFE